MAATVWMHTRRPFSVPTPHISSTKSGERVYKGNWSLCSSYAACNLSAVQSDEDSPSTHILQTPPPPPQRRLA